MADKDEPDDEHLELPPLDADRERQDPSQIARVTKRARESPPITDPQSFDLPPLDADRERQDPSQISMVTKRARESPPITDPQSEDQRVTVVDFDMRFESMVVFMIKWMLASIPAAIILYLLFAIFGAFLFGAFSAMTTASAATLPAECFTT